MAQNKISNEQFGAQFQELKAALEPLNAKVEGRIQAAISKFPHVAGFEGNLTLPEQAIILRYVIGTFEDKPASEPAKAPAQESAIEAPAANTNGDQTSTDEATGLDRTAAFFRNRNAQK